MTPDYNGFVIPDQFVVGYGLDYNASQIAEILDINSTAVHMRLSRARQRLALA